MNGVCYVSELEESPSSHKNGEHFNQRADPMVILKSEVRQAGRRAGEQARRRAGEQAGRQADWQAGGHAGRQAGRRAGGQAGGQAGRQAPRCPAHRGVKPVRLHHSNGCLCQNIT